MKIQFLGTGAADYTEEHKKMPGYRRNSSALVDGRILIDPGPSVPDAIASFGIDIEKIEYVLSTHTHSDHFNAQTLALLEKNGARLLSIADGQTEEIGGYRITALLGNHSVRVQHFLIDDGKSKLFYGLDSAWLTYGEVQAILSGGADLAVLDGTVGFIEGDYRVFEHCSMPMILTMAKTLCASVKKICISHMARTLHTDHETLAARMGKEGVLVAFDGQILEF